MTPAEFNKLAKLHRIRGNTLEACQMVLIDGSTWVIAANRAGVQQSTIGRAIKRLQRPVCGECGRPKQLKQEIKS